MNLKKKTVAQNHIGKCAAVLFILKKLQLLLVQNSFLFINFFETK